MNLKKIIVIFILGNSLAINAQYINDWQVGISLTPFIFSRINSDYQPEKAKQDFPNGFGFGLTIEKNWNENWGIKTGVEYSTQNQKYDNFIYEGGTVYLNTVDADFTYYKVPITVQYFYPIKDNLYLTFNQGFQVSFLNDYKTVVDSDLRTQTFEGNTIYGYIKTSGATYTDDYGSIYKNQTYGITGSIGLKGFFSEKISYSTNLRYQYDLTSSDSDNGFFSDNNNTKNFCLGLELGLQYHFSIGDRFNSSPHKL
jgi:hypothetical protein